MKTLGLENKIPDTDSVERGSLQKRKGREKERVIRDFSQLF